MAMAIKLGKECRDLACTATMCYHANICKLQQRATEPTVDVNGNVFSFLGIGKLTWIWDTNVRSAGG